jgi:hypothetical protein
MRANTTVSLTRDNSGAVLAHATSPSTISMAKQWMFGLDVGGTRPAHIRVLQEVVMIVGIVFLTVFFTLGTVLLLMSHYSLITEDARCIAQPGGTPPVRDEAM